MTTRTTRRRFLTSTAALATALTQRRALAAIPEQPRKDDPTPYKLFFNQPATQWPDSLPVGNGRLGACVFGNPSLDRIQLNEESIWDGDIRDRNNPRAGEAVPKIRELLFSGKIAEAEALAVSDMLSIPRRMPCYQTLGDLHLDFTLSGITPDVEDYRLELNLDTAIASMTFTHAGTSYTREVFSSAPDQVIIIRLTASQPGKLSFTARLDRPANFTASSIAPNRLTLTGEAFPVNDNPGLSDKEHHAGIKYYAELQAVTEGGNASTSNDTLTITSANAVTLFIDCATSYRYPANTTSTDRFNTGDTTAMQSAVRRNITNAQNRTYADLRSRHIADHQRIFRRAEISFGPDPNASIPTDQRIRHIKQGGEDIHIIPLYVQYGRYMLISSSRPGTLAANLQGIWNESVDPPWGSKYTININTEMNYWLAERANLSDLHTPLFDLIDSTRGPGSTTARDYYKARGYVVHHNTDIWGDSAPIDGLGGGIWAMGGAWLSTHLWEHFDYTGDTDFLRDRAWPRLRENSLFLLDYLTPAPAGTPYAGYLVTGPSCSPENKYQLPNGKSYNLCMGPTMDIEITRAVLTLTLRVAEQLGIEATDSGANSVNADLLTRARAALTKLPPFKITHDGRLQEWPEDYTDHEPGHRHISHLWALFPGDQITPHRTPELAKACRATLDARLAHGGGSTGWSRSWIISCMARLEDGDAAYQNILQLFRQSTRPNLFDVCGLKENSPFQIDGNLGGPTGIIEMLLQSHPSGPKPDVNIIRFLPALPSAWPEGHFHGLRARGGLDIDLAWQNGKATTATIRATLKATHHFSAPKGQKFESATLNFRRVDIKRSSELTLPLNPKELLTLTFV
ncbi:alpha/beta hydrolase [Edaphobacter acidisoli]|uniref:Alpha/beta hydrolase n=1 Tax=Edaphobacter acidisoli TaxID=2040573 RepID=A0A916RFP2_9BACT|nr:glycoside hydrolase family 95 protein [Edaphobacter acidisoli]GGA54227.1 alpha/beta hydrolase [Edaphobacter acidisoli]